MCFAILTELGSQTTQRIAPRHGHFSTARTKTLYASLRKQLTETKRFNLHVRIQGSVYSADQLSALIEEMPSERHHLLRSAIQELIGRDNIELLGELFTRFDRKDLLLSLNQSERWQTILVTISHHDLIQNHLKILEFFHSQGIDLFQDLDRQGKVFLGKKIIKKIEQSQRPMSPTQTMIFQDLKQLVAQAATVREPLNPPPNTPRP
jgi:hypothetical protein